MGGVARGGRTVLPEERQRPAADLLGAHAADHFLQHWFNLADQACEEALYDSISLRRFAGIDLGGEPVPDATSLLRFRHLLEQHKLGEKLFAAEGKALQAMKNATISNVKRTHSVFRWAFPFQSWNQFTSFIFFAACGLFCFIVVLRVFDHTQLPIWIFLTAVIGASSPVFAVFPGRFEILHVTGKVHIWLSLIKDSLSTLGYIPEESSEMTRYRSKLPSWLCWKENEIVIKCNDNSIVVIGPIFSVRLLQSKLARKI